MNLELLKEMIQKTESMDQNEKQYWFDILPSMTEAQVQKLFDILDTERTKLAALEVKYQEEIRQINEKRFFKVA